MDRYTFMGAVLLQEQILNSINQKCIRCRKKKVKCDFVQPACGRCTASGFPCSYATPPRRVDGQAFDQLGNHVKELKERMQKMHSELAGMKDNFYNSNHSTHSDAMSTNHININNTIVPIHSIEKSQNNDNQSVTWKLSLSPSGLRIDTNIATVADLYRILLNGISQLNINQEPTTSSLFDTDPIRSARHKVPGNNGVGLLHKDQSSERLWEVNDREAQSIRQKDSLPHQQRQQQQQQQASIEDDTTIPDHVLTNLMHTCYQSCFLSYQIVDQEDFLRKYQNPSGQEALLKNSINAWISKHGCIYHNACNGEKDPTTVGEVYFKKARELLKKCFDVSSPITIQALLNLYMYQLSRERSNLAYLYIGLAIRMAQDLKLHKKEHMSEDLYLRETNKRLWWSAYWLDLCAALESNRPTMVDDKDCDLDYPTKLDTEDEETGYRINFSVYSIKLMKIRKNITKHLPSEQSGQSLLSAISRLETALTNWHHGLPFDFRFDLDQDNDAKFVNTGTFRDESRLILNIQYQTTWIMLHKLFLPKKEQEATPVSLLSLNICTKSANCITQMLEIYSKQLHWCHFFYVLDGVIASVSIHQINAFFQGDKEVAYTAQRNLLSTAYLLRKSPLVYMEKVNDIIDNIEDFLKSNHFSMDFDSLVPLNSQSQPVSEPSSSIFHHKMFDATASFINDKVPVPIQFQPQTIFHPTCSGSTTESNITPQMTNPILPQQVLLTNQFNTQNQMQQLQPSDAVVTRPTSSTLQPSFNSSNTEHHYSESNTNTILLNNPNNSLANFNIQADNQQQAEESAMDHLLLGFEMPHPEPLTNNASYYPRIQQRQQQEHQLSKPLTTTKSTTTTTTTAPATTLTPIPLTWPHYPSYYRGYTDDKSPYSHNSNGIIQQSSESNELNQFLSQMTDHDAVNALIYSSSSTYTPASTSSSSSAVLIDYQQQQQQQPTFDYDQQKTTQFYPSTSSSNRKRLNREWDPSSSQK